MSVVKLKEPIMDGFLSLLLFAGFFYFMMRFGCGSHMVHGHGSGMNGDMGSNTATDPVCGMTVQPGEGYAKMHQGRQYQNYPIRNEPEGEG